MTLYLSEPSNSKFLKFEGQCISQGILEAWFLFIYYDLWVREKNFASLKVIICKF